MEINYLESVLWLLSWPALIILSYYIVKFVIKKLEAKIDQEEKKA
jgi:uncharacterized membrane protein YjfL (UPF0719 family)